MYLYEMHRNAETEEEMSVNVITVGIKSVDSAEAVDWG